MRPLHVHRSLHVRTKPDERVYTFEREDGTVYDRVVQFERTLTWELSWPCFCRAGSKRQ